MDEKDKKPQTEFNYDEFIDGEFNVELSEPNSVPFYRGYMEKRRKRLISVRTMTADLVANTAP